MLVDKRPWLNVKARFEAGKPVPLAVREMAEAVLGERFIRPAKVNRPDAWDRAAGDDSFDPPADGGLTVL